MSSIASARWMCDVLIVGGGPAGSSLAWALRESGLKVILVDKSVFPRDKVCAGWITPSIVAELKLDLADYGRGRVLQPISGFNVRRVGGPEKQVRYDNGPVSYGIRRCEFDHYLLERCGADIRTDHSFQAMERVGDHWIVDGSIKTPLVVGAGGHFCPVARHLGARPGLNEVTVAAQETEFRMSPEQVQACKVRGDVPELYFCDDLKGYGWIFRKGDYLNIGIGREDQHHLSRHVREFCLYLDSLGRLPPGALEKFKGHAYLLYGHANRKVVDDGVLLIGDAAGLAFTRSGEGIRPAIESGLLAAQVIKMANGVYSPANLEHYVERIFQRFGRRPTRSIIDHLPVWLSLTLAGKLLSTRFFVRNLVIDRWFLHRHQLPL